MEKLFEFLQWWWENNIDYIKANDPWVIPLFATSIPLSFIVRALSVFISIWRRK
ncbi:MAG: hypothetical protein ACRCVY_09845 [Commensalibacter sp.]